MKDLCAEIISVGTEILLGNITNTDARDVSVALSELGINVFWHTVVGDNAARLSEAVAVARGRADVIITTGGLGPTYDDMTKQTLSECFGLPLIFHPEQAEKIRGHFSAMGREMTDNNLAQAYLPEGCTVLENHCGTAPGCAFFAHGKHVVMMPGPPAELRMMLRTGALPYLSSLSDKVLVSHDIKLFGLSESAIDEIMGDIMKNSVNPSLAPYCATGEVRLRVTARSGDAAEAEAMTRPIIAETEKRLGQYIYGIDVDSLEQAAFLGLKKASLSLSCAESCTGGLIAERITAIPGASSVFLGGVAAYSNAVKTGLLGVKPETLERFGAVSRETAVEMAEGVRALTGSDVAVSTTGLCGPDSDGSETPVGTVYVALADASGTQCRRLFIPGDRGRCRTLAAHNAFDMIIKTMQLTEGYARE